jgi:enoyl-[acyl-carrier protein] reductase II
MCGAMSWISERNLVSAISNAGGFGVIAGGAMMPDQLEAEIIATKSLTDRPFGVNIITLHPKCEELVGVCISQGVSHVILGGGLPRSATIQRLKDANVKVICFAPALSIANRLVSYGVDGLVIEGSEAGGHIGPVSTAVLAQEILPNLAHVLPIFVAGGIGTGTLIGSFLRLGAAGCQLGTRFVCAKESIAHPKFKASFINASSRDAVASVQLDSDFPVIPVRALHNKASREFLTVQRQAIEDYKSGAVSKQDAQLEIEKFWVGALRRAVIDGDIESGSLMAGQSVGMVTKEQTAQEIVDELVAQLYAFMEPV